MIPVKFGRPQEGIPPDSELPAPGSRPVNPLDPSILNELWEAKKSDQLSESPLLRPIIEQTIRRGEVPTRNRQGREVIRQRYPDGKIQIVREVAQDGEGNYFNHGRWQLFNRQGEVLAEGNFQEGLMHGYWSRWHPKSGSAVFSTPPYNQFPGPYFSTATFDRGQLDGLWTLFDRQRRKIFEIPYRDGKRNGTATWWFPNGLPMRQVTYADNLIDGSLKEWTPENRLVRHDEFIAGRRIVRETSLYVAKQAKETENFFLDSRLELGGEDDWWAAQPASYFPSGDRTQHGPALAWHASGQLKMKGQYRNGKRTGAFTWWHPNGQKQLEGTYRDGLKSGTWTWWHENGLRAVQGQHRDDQPVGVWTWWDDTGRVESETNYDDLDDAESVVDLNAATPADEESESDPQGEPEEVLPYLKEKAETLETLPLPRKEPDTGGSAERPTGSRPLPDDSGLPGLEGPANSVPSEILVPAELPLPTPPKSVPASDRTTRRNAGQQR